jgi:hypothetical protein
MLDLLVSQDRSQLARRIWEQVRAGSLRAATIAIEEFVEQSEDENLIQAARTSAANLNWAHICAEAVEADVQLQGVGEAGCCFIVLDLGNQPERRCDIIRHYHASDNAAGKVRKGRPAGRIGGYHALLHEPPVKATGLERLAQLQLSPYPAYPSPPEEQQAHQRRRMLAGHLLVLRYFGAVQHYAQKQGFPFALSLQVAVESITGEDAIRQLDPSFSMELASVVRPISAEAEEKLGERHRMHVAKWQEDTETIFRNIRSHFKEKGYVPSSWLPDELGETKQRLRSLEGNLMLLHPLHRMTLRECEALALRVREVRDATTPRPIDLTRYRLPS